MKKRAYITEPVRGKAKSFFMAASILLLASLVPGVGVGLAFRCSLYTFYICLAVFTPLLLFFFCARGAHRRLYRGARDGMTNWPLLKYAVRSEEYAMVTGHFDWLGNNARFFGNPSIGPWEPYE